MAVFKRFFIAFASVVILTIQFNTYADSQSSTPPTSPQTSQQQQLQQTEQRNLFFCPPITALKKDPVKMNWTATNGWKSYGISFVENIKSFMGAQWYGANVGQITCIYKGAELHSFPVLLIFNTLTLEPQGSLEPSPPNQATNPQLSENNANPGGTKWTKNLGGYRNCVSNSEKECPFQMQLAPPKEDVYKQALQLKNEENKDQNQKPQNPGF